MYDFTGQECPICKKKFAENDDVVVCPACGTPHHRSCWQEHGVCANQQKHASGFEWTPVTEQKVQADATPNGTADHQAQETAASDKEHNPNRSGFDYSQLYNSTYTPPQQSEQAQEAGIPNLDPDSTIEQIPVADWSVFLGNSNYLYMMLFKQMELMHRRAVFCFSAAVFGPFYFAYRKAWKPALIWAMAQLLVNAPAMLYALQVTGSPLTAGMSADFLYRLAATASVLTLPMMFFRGFYGVYWYKNESIKQINKIRDAYPDANQRQYVLRAKGGTSWSAVFLLAGIMILIGIVASFFVGPDINALYQLLV